MRDGSHHNVYVDHVIASLKELSDITEQKRLWVSSGANGAEFSSFVEAIERLFSDSGLLHELHRGWRAKRGGRAETVQQPPVFNKRIDSLFERLHWLASKVDESLAPESLIALPEMEQVRCQASELLQALASFSGHSTGPG